MNGKIVIRQMMVRDTGFSDKRTGKVVQEQVAELHIPGKVVPLEVRLRVGKNGPTALGEYELDPESFQQKSFGQIGFYPRCGAKLGLEPVKAKAG